MRKTKSKLLSRLAGALAIGLLAIAPAASSAAEGEVAPETETSLAPLAGCFANYVCVYQDPNYGGEQRNYPCSEATNATSNIFIRSALNRCGNKVDYLNSSQGVICMAPGGERPDPGTFASVTIPEQYGNIC